MDFDSIIPIIFVIVFFILPNILKQLRGKVKKSVPKNTAKKKSFIFGKIGEKIQEFIQELERQAQLQREKNADADDGWEMFVEDEENFSDLETKGRRDDVSDARTIVTQEEVDPSELEETVRPKEIIQPENIDPSILKHPVQPGYATHRFKENQLQNAIIWSEILSKPVALREKGIGN